MYHCNVCFYLIGCQNWMAQIVRGMTPLSNFTHEIIESRCLDREFTAKADVILADVHGTDVRQVLNEMLTCKKETAQIILLVNKEQITFLDENLSALKDIWSAELSEQELRFRLAHWQRDYKMEKDFWLTKNYLETTINSVPHLIWYKDKEGVHKKVNESFCKAVNKTMEQIEGRGHFYIWDIEPDEYAKGEFICMESEYEVMEKRQTCVFDENVKIGDSMRELKTYKTPLFDLDGSVMGTVGVANDVTQERIYERMIINNANTDFLTKLYNRRYVYQYIEEREGQPFTIYYIDLDNFKTINDKFGHHEGDRALTMTAGILRECMPEAMIARVGGDEFLIVELGENKKDKIEEKRKWLEERLDQVYKKDDMLSAISASIGSAYTDTGKAALDALVREADSFMYNEKNRKKQQQKVL
ncbi:MAG: GGDEF domain-containing protein [Roseburia sp.]|nr:GGDEF domain-containing protein [Roseburia sp.]MCM1242852.1 GGDEF domain-containing protein [Roseburia sp.]